ncbi:hypothetical protein JOM56_013678 [Amanita muscaria]
MYSSRVSLQFNAEDAEIHFKSSDNVLFFIHRESLKHSAARFLPFEFKAIKHEIVQVSLPETSDVLELLFAFLYPKPLPDVKGLPFKTLAHLAEAAETYQVFSAMMICNMRMTVVVNDHPVDVLRYAVIYHYKELIDISAPVVIGRPLPEAIDRLPPNTIAAWGKYFQQWLDGLVKVYADDCPEHMCVGWNYQCANAMERLGGKIVSLRNVELILACSESDKAKSCCSSSMKKWRSNALDTVNRLRPFSVFLYPNSSS